jgi:hypothetical protein
MPATYEPIASTTLGSAAANVEFTSISGSFTDLRVILSGTGSSSTQVDITVNGDTGTNYSWTGLSGNGTSAESYRLSSRAQIRPDYYNSIGSSDPGVIIVDFMSYANANVFKTVLMTSALAGAATHRNVGLWRSTSAITSVKFAATVGNFASGFRVSLYAIKAA